MEETTGVAGETTPAENKQEEVTEATPVVPEKEAQPDVPVADQSEIDAASECNEDASAPTTDDVSEEVVPEQNPEAAAAEQPQDNGNQTEEVEIGEETIKMAVDLIKRTRRSSAAHFQRKMCLSLNQVEKLLDILTEKGILGPKEVNHAPRKILIEFPAPQNHEPVKERRVVTDYDRMQTWKEHLQKIGHYTDEAFINAMADYAIKNNGYNPRFRWGSCLIVMINRLANRTLNSLRTFTQNDADYLQKELLRFFSEKPLGDNPVSWNTKYTTNQDQKKAISDFFGINCPFKDLKGKPNAVMTAIRDAAWPNQMEEKKGTGGTFAERFHYLAMCVVRFATSGMDKHLFENSFHTEPTQEFLDRVSGNRRGFKSFAPRWIKDGKCVDCDSPITKDSNGNDICSNPICPHNIACVATDVAKSFRNGHSKFERPDIQFDPNNAPLPQKDNRRGNWKDRRRKNDDDDSREFSRGPRKHGKRWHANDDELPDGDNPSVPVSEPRTVFSAGGSFENNAFAGLTLPEKKDEQPENNDASEAPKTEA